MFPKLLTLSNPASQYQSALMSISKSSRFQTNISQTHSKQFTEFLRNQKFIDSGIMGSQLKVISQLRKELLKLDKFDTVVVAPLRKSLQTCYELFRQNIESIGQNKNQPKLQFFIEPLLGDRLNGTYAIGNMSARELSKENEKYEKFVQNYAKVMSNQQWMYDILPRRVIAQLPNNAKLTSGQEYLKLLKSSPNNEFETKQQFSQRIQRLKQSILEYQKISGSGKTILVIASAQVINFLGTTDFQQNGTPVNPLRMQPGEVDLVYLVVNGKETVRQLDFEGVLPFCR